MTRREVDIRSSKEYYRDRLVEKEYKSKKLSALIALSIWPIFSGIKMSKNDNDLAILCVGKKFQVFKNENRVNRMRQGNLGLVSERGELIMEAGEIAASRFDTEIVESKKNFFKDYEERASTIENAVNDFFVQMVVRTDSKSYKIKKLPKRSVLRAWRNEWVPKLNNVQDSSG